MLRKLWAKSWRVGMVAAVLLAAGCVAALGCAAGDDAPKELSDAERARLEKRATELNQRVLALHQQGQLDGARKLCEEALALRQQLYPKERYPDGHPDLAASLNNLGFLLQAQGDSGKALDYLQQALQMRRQLFPREKYPDGHPDLASTLTNVGFLLRAQGEYDKALDCYQEALQMNQRLYPRERYPDGHTALATSLNNMGAVLEHQGEYGKAAEYHAQGLRMRRRLYPRERFPDGHPELAASLNNLGHLLHAQGEYVKALDYYQQVLQMDQQLYPKERFPNGHPKFAISLNNMGALLKSQGDYGRAGDYFRQALEMRQQLYPRERYPNGHPDLVQSLNNLGELMTDQGEDGKALQYHRQALEMEQRLYPKERYPSGLPDLALTLNNLGRLYWRQGEHGKARDACQQALQMWEQLYPKERYPNGHPLLANSLNNLGFLLDTEGEYDKALDCYQQALQMNQRLYPRERFPNGHPLLARTLSSLGFLLERHGEYNKALDYFQQALEMRQALYPKGRYPGGHPDLASSLHGLSVLWYDQGEYGKALAYLRQELQMNQQQSRALVDAASEAEALNFLARLPRTRDPFLSVTADPERSDPDRDYALLWQGKALVSGALLHRQQLLRGLSDDDSRRQAEELLDVRRRLARLLLAPAEPPIKDRDKRLQELTERKEGLERELARRLPDFQRHQALERAPHTDLLDKLPAHTAFIDFLAYYRCGKDSKAQTVPHYAAFVLRHGEPVRRVEFGPAEPIEQALARWRRDIGNNLNSVAAERLRRLLWDRLTPALGSDTTIYISPDGNLNALPWAGLPGTKPGSFLLEEYTIALVPHGPFLLEQLTAVSQGRGGKDMLLAVGGIAYDEKPQLQPEPRRPAAREGMKGKWHALPGTEKELRQILALAGKRDGLTVLDRHGRDACTQQVLLDLQGARWAHLATHGFFAAPATEERKALLHEQDFQYGVGSERRGVGARNPLVQAGLVLAGANLPPKQDALTDDHGLLTGEALAGADLRRLDLVVLSACQTGLGETTAGEGVFGLQRAFHLGGARNVVASLWQVDDEATAALMALFYHNLWVKGQPPLEALRNAQLALLRHPEEIAALAKERGSPFENVVKRTEQPAAKPAAGKTAAVKHWAGFILSGLGR
jgi:CHAT domain-containing protein/Tfp pilus assembly protein PilF